MHRPVIEYGGREREVHSVTWYRNDGGFRSGEVQYVTFYTGLGDEIETAFCKQDWEKEGYDEHGHLRLDFSKRLKWSEPDVDV